MFSFISRKRVLGYQLPMFAAVFAASFALSASSALANGIQVLTAVTPGQYVNVWTNLGTAPVLQIFVNPPIHDAPANTYNKNSVPFAYTVDYAVCSNTPTRIRVIGRYDRNGGKHSNLSGTAQSQWVTFENKTFSTSACRTQAEPIPGWPGYTMCLGQPVQSSGTVDMSSVTAGNTTMQFVAKMYGGSFFRGFFPDEQIVTGQPAVAITAVNLWLNWGTPTSSSSSSSVSSSSSSSSSVGVGCIEIRKTALNPAGQALGTVPQFTYHLDGQRTVQNDSTGYARFDNVPAGGHLVTEILPQGWSLVSINPSEMITVNPGSNCTQINVINRQNNIGNSSSSSIFRPECSDGVDNLDTEDNLADSLDPGCHTDGNPNNPGSYDPNDPSESNNSSSSSSVRFTIEVDDDEDEVKPGDSLTYVITVKNESNFSVNNVTVTNELDRQVEFDDCEPSCSDSGRTQTWSGLNFSANETKTFYVDGEVDEDADDGDELKDTARVMNESDTDRTDVEEDDVKHDDDDDDADVEIEKSASTSEVFPGGMIQYTVRIENTGDTDLEDLTVTDHLPAGVQVIDDGNADRNNGGQLVWEIDQLDQGDTWTAHYRVSVPQWTQPGTILRNDVRVMDEEDSVNVGTMAVVSVIGMLPQTGTDAGSAVAVLISIVGMGLGVGAAGRKFFI